ncbi:MAG: ATP-dependent RecD-like DNA helicase [Suipraeoptans sp.]
MEAIKGYVDHIVYRNKENGYTVFILDTEDGELTCVGNFLVIEEGDFIKLEGEYVLHPSYGTQLKVKTAEVLEADDVISIERYLGSGAIKGIGAVIAGKIVKKFKEDTFRIIEEEPERLTEISGISEKKARNISLQMEEKRDARKAMIFLQKYGVSTALSAKIYAKYENKVYSIIEENPYQLADEVVGVGFKTADEIAARVGILQDSEYRIKSGILYALSQGVNEGSVFLYKEELLTKTNEILGLDVDEIETYIMDLAMEKRIVIKSDGEVSQIYPATYYYMELNVARMLVDLNLRFDIMEVVVEKRISDIEKKTGIILDEAQRDAIRAAIESGVLILTGGPGTGKTTTINSLINFFMQEDMKVVLAAPTGRAAKRMTETTGYEASTIHRLLDVSGNPEEGVNGFNKNELDPLECDVVIIDEVSMVDLPLMQALLKAIVPGTRLILVGDRNQLPSVGAGSILEDVIKSDRFRTVKLTKIFRQAQESDIVVNAHKINKGEKIELNNKSKDFFFLKRYQAETIINVILLLIKEKLPGYVGAKPEEIQVISPTRKGLLGVENLNKVLQENLNPSNRDRNEKSIGDRVFREGDKVMQTKNNYQLEWEISTYYGMTIDKGVGVFNGDTGVVKTINSYEETMQVEFDENKIVTYPFSLLDEVDLAYAITVHKSQGSEYPAVVIPMFGVPRQLCYRNLIYTAITRARSCVTIVGDERIFYDMTGNENEGKRNTTLDVRIREME